MTKDLKPIKNHFPKRIFISRSNASKRRLLNEDEIFDFLHSYGFEKNVLEKLSFIEQILLFKGAEVIVGPHGAGFTNLLFCQENNLIIELFPESYVNQCFWTIASQKRLRYGYITSQLMLHTDETNHLKDSDFTIATSDLFRMLKQLKITQVS